MDRVPEHLVVLGGGFVGLEFAQAMRRFGSRAPGVWAMGDCAGSPLFTHVSFDDFRIVHNNLNGGNRTTHGLPYTVLRDAILTHPTMAEGLITLFAAVPPIRG